MRATGTDQMFRMDGPFGGDLDQHKVVDMDMVGHSPSFKTVSRSKLDRIAGTRPKYEMEFNNGMNRYNVKYVDKKVPGKVALGSPEVKPRVAQPNKHCHRGLKRLAEIALNVRKSTQAPAPRLYERNNMGNQSSNRMRLNKSTNQITRKPSTRIF